MGPSLLFPGLPLNENTRRTIAQQIRTLFAGGLSGAWYDPTDLSTMWTTTNATFQVAATGDTVGIMLDKRLGLTRSFVEGPIDQFDFTAAGTEPPTTNSADTYDGQNCVSVTFPTLATGGYAVSRANGGLGLAAWPAVVGEFYRISYKIAFSRPLVSNEQIVVYSTGVTAGASFTINAANDSTEWQSLANGALFNAVGAGAVYPVIYTDTVPLGSPLTVYLRDYTVEKVAGNHLYQATSTYRPVFRDVAGRRYLEFDGVDDWLRALFTIAQPIDRISAIRQVSSTPDDRLFGGGSTASGSLYQTGTSPRIAQYSGTATFSVGDLAVGVNGVVTELHNGASSRLAVNNIAYTVGNAGTSVPGGITIGASDLSVSAGNLFLHQLIMRGGTAMTDAQISLCRKVCYAAAGIPFPGYEETEVSRMWSSDPTAVGAWYDPSDLSTMFQASGGGFQTPVTATGQSVGLILDKSKGLALGTPLVFNSDFSDNGAGWTISGNDGTHIVTFNNPGARYQSDTTTPSLNLGYIGILTAGLWYAVDVEITAYVSGTLKVSGYLETSIPTSVGTHRVYMHASSSTLNFYRNSTNIDLTIGSVTVRTIAGNHAYQTTSASRPIFRDVGGLRYLEFDGVDDYLRATFTIAQPIDRISALQQVSWTSGDMLFAGSGVAAGSLYQITGTPRLDMSSGGTAITLAPQLALSTNGVVTERHNGASSRLALNSGAYAVADAGATAPAGITIGANQSAGAPSNMLLHQMIMRGTVTAMTDAQIAACRALCAVKSGVTL